MSYSPNNINGQATMANSAPVTVASDQSNIPTNTKQLNGVTISVGNGVTDTGTQKVTLSSDSTGQVKLATGAAVIGALTANQSVNAAQINGVAPLMGNGVTGTGSLRVTLASDTTTNTNPLYTKQQAQTTGGATAYQLISAATTNATSLKASAGTLYGVQVFNTGAAAAFLKLYNKATAPTVGTDTPVKTIGIPAGGGSNLPITDIGVAFPAGIAFAITGLNTVADTTAVTASQVTVAIDYV